MMIKFFRRMVGKVWRCIRPPLRSTLVERYPQYQIGRGSYGDLSVHSWGEDATLTIGNYTSIAAGVKVFLGGEHRYDWVTTFPFSVLWESARQHEGHPKTKGNVHIGNDVWIGTEALISSGVTIGDGAVVGARAMVTRDVAPYAVVAGNPARVVKFRFDAQVVSRLIELKWWDWHEREIEKAMPELLNNQIQLFIEKAERGDYL
ncbi:Chloramphenicol acetyltransferase [Polaromonas vacuolata]|uniref:Chloramphenicol acetyltransferase n=1 Tax=Polaromonas vacuolata TaxID=37448 RepID=A0A6H2H7D6_9BURK|nr:CatB-related O-acetyltransferase [Polaromonas vacuolata]QJC55775.1 Chloramphenicol acetyltransferase [Polaromonas vacuolata]